MRSDVAACTLPQLCRACIPSQVFPFRSCMFFTALFLGVECAIACACVRPAAAAPRVCLQEGVHIFSPGIECAIVCGCVLAPQLRRACVLGEVCNSAISLCISVHMDVG